ncbi:predicted protein [Uncinocarpus reesii 1704]|uniref:Uncharacterized protein n=1 Tax=Uncinocarpus reesii (strain UAMH 1704) TaxID=336963 RepID=C4JKV0_UNCRE|nr:uncharacterized protein UREG_00165 [Uncinocarpus reesii 1704]EEP75319.1 predicted protein [Uncinocarpus reesii 1704]
MRTYTVPYHLCHGNDELLGKIDIRLIGLITHHSAESFPQLGFQSLSPATMSDYPILAVLQTWCGNFTTNVSSSISNLTIRDYIRLVWIIGGYLFLRPYLDKGFRKMFERGAAKSEKEEADAEADQMMPTSNPNLLRDGRDQETEDEDEGDSSAVPQWGKSARRKQRKFMEYLEQEAERRKEEDDDKDIADLLED